MLGSDLLVFAQGATVGCRDARTGHACWMRAFPDGISWLGRHADVVLAAGPTGIHGLRLADGETLWEHAAGPLGEDYGPPLADAGGGKLAAFQQVDSRLFFLQDERRLFALDAESGRVLWTCWAPAARLNPPYPGGRFYPRYHAGADWLVVQTGGGQRWVLESRTGQKVHEAPTNPEPWPRAPLALDDGRVCLVPNTRQVVVFDPATGHEIWTYQAEPSRWPSLSGEAPQVLGDPSTLLVLTARNHGYELQPVDARTGQPRWPASRLISPSGVDLASAAFDGETLLFISRNALEARELTEGKRLWELSLTGSAGPWQVVRARRAVVAFPRRVRAGDSFPVFVCDPKDGHLMQRLNFPASAPRAAVQLGEKNMAVLVGDQMWGLRADAR
jgi:outer membrane protein assembly factor BamB